MVKRSSTRNKKNDPKKRKLDLIAEEATQPSEAPQGDVPTYTSPPTADPPDTSTAKVADLPQPEPSVEDFKRLTSQFEI